MTEKYDNDFYETAGDPLKKFRKKYKGAIIAKNGKDPFNKDPDVIQSIKEEKLKERINNIDINGYNSY